MPSHTYIKCTWEDLEIPNKRGKVMTIMCHAYHPRVRLCIWLLSEVQTLKCLFTTGSRNRESSLLLPFPPSPPPHPLSSPPLLPLSTFSPPPPFLCLLLFLGVLLVYMFVIVCRTSLHSLDSLASTI